MKFGFGKKPNTVSQLRIGLERIFKEQSLAYIKDNIAITTIAMEGDDFTVSLLSSLSDHSPSMANMWLSWFIVISLSKNLCYLYHRSASTLNNGYNFAINASSV